MHVRTGYGFPRMGYGASSRGVELALFDSVSAMERWFQAQWNDPTVFYAVAFNSWDTETAPTHEFERLSRAAR